MTAAPQILGSQLGRKEQTNGFRSDIQGLRAIAVGGVLIYHAGVAVVGGGFVGVDVFFVISGFLITSHLLRSLELHGRIELAQFYARRARRILPASFAVLAATIVGVLIWIPPSLQPGFLKDAAATALYVPNVLFAVQGTDYLAETAPSPLQHYWSLGVEEQFYVIWPAVLLLLWLVSRRSRLKVGALVTVIALVSLGCAVLLTFSSAQPWAFFSLPTRAWELLVGALVAVGVPWISRWPSVVAFIAGWLGAVLIVGSMVLLDSTTPFPGYVALVPVVGSALVIAAGTSKRVPGLDRVLSIRPMQFIGRISYSLYLVHWPLLVIPAAATGEGTVLDGWAGIGVVVASVPLAWVLYRAIETPFLRRPWSTNRRPRVVLAASLCTSLIFVAVAGGTAFGISARPIDAGVDNRPVSGLTVPPVFSDVVPRNMQPSLTTASRDLPAIYSDGCHVNGASEEVPTGCTFGDPSAKPVVALFGDSHAAQWFPALRDLADQRGFRLESFTKSSCPAADVRMVTDGVEDVACAEWRAEVMRILNASPPDVVVISGFSHYVDYGTTSVDESTWNAGLATTLAALPTRARVLVISDTPAFELTPSACLSSHVTDASACSRPRAEAVSADWASAESATAESAGASVLSLNDYLCSPDVCGVVIGDRLLYRDAHHLTASFVQLLAGPLWDSLGPLLADS